MSSFLFPFSLAQNNQGTRPNFKYTKNSEEALPYAHYIDNTMPSMEMDTSLLSSVHPNSYQVTSQTMDTASMSSALAAENDEAESGISSVHGLILLIIKHKH